MPTTAPRRPTLLTPEVTASGGPLGLSAAGGACGRVSLDAALRRVQSPPFESPLVFDLAGCVDADRAQLVRVLDVLRWRSVWSPVAVVCPEAMRPQLDEIGFAPAVPVFDAIAAAWCAVSNDRQLRGPGRRGAAPIGTFGVTRSVRTPISELIRVDAMRRARPVIRWP